MNPRWSTSCYDIHRSNNHKIDNDHNNNNNNNKNNNNNNDSNNYHTANIFDVEPMESVV